MQLEAQWTEPLWDDMRGSTGIHLSKEYDYLSIAVNGSLAKDFNHKNTTVSAGVSLAFDTIDPETGRPIAFSKMVLDQGLTQSLVNEDRPTESTRHISTGKQSMHWIAGLLIFPIDMLPIIGTLTPTPLILDCPLIWATILIFSHISDITNKVRQSFISRSYWKVQCYLFMPVQIIV